MINVLKEQVASGGITQFITFGWNNSELRDRKAAGDNFAKVLESIAPGIPVLLMDNSGHNAVCNTTVLVKSGLLEHPSVRGGEVCLDAQGIASGYVSDQAVSYVFEKAFGEILSMEQFQETCKIAQDMLLRMGYTNAFDAYLNQYCETSAFEALKALDDKDELTINGAWQLGIEKERGSIKEGKYADFVILDKNILEYEKDQYNKIGETKVVSTYFEGKNVYSAN